MTDDERQGLLMNDFLRVPNIILQMQSVLGNGNTYACLQFIWAKTGGWKQNEDTLSYSQFANDKRYGTGLSVRTIQRSVEKLEALGVINKQNSFNNMYEFSLNIANIRELVEAQAKTKSHGLEAPSLDKLSVSLDSLSVSLDKLSVKPRQIGLHTRTITQEPLHKNITLEPKKEKTAAKKKPAPKKRKHDIPSGFTITENQQKKCDEYGIDSQALIEGFDNFHSSKGNQFVDWSKAFSTWLNNHIKFEKLKPVSQQGNNNGNYQSANSQPSQQSHFDKLRAEAAAKYGNAAADANEIRTVN